MKACIYIKKSRGRGRGQTLALLKHCAGEGRSIREVDDGQSRVTAIDAYGLVGGLDISKMGELRDNLLRLHHGGRGKDMAKHVVLSCEDVLDPIARRAATRLLRRLAGEFLRVYAPGCAALAFVHNDRQHPHLHMVICNSNGDKSIHWSRAQLRQMQSMEWMAKDLALLVTSGRRKSRRVQRNPYPTAKLTVAEELAALPPAELEMIPWVKRGNTRVFTYKGRRVRERLIERERQKHETTLRHNGTAGSAAEDSEASDDFAPRTPSIVNERGGTAQASAGNLAGGSGADGVGQAHRILAQTLQSLQEERRQRRTKFPAPEIV